MAPYRNTRANIGGKAKRKRKRVSNSRTTGCFLAQPRVSARLWFNHRDTGMRACDRNELDLDLLHAKPT
jgi:hypothetical protein